MADVLDRAALRRLAEAASPGPWRACWYGPNEPTMLERVQIHAPDDEGPLIADFFTGGEEAPKQQDNAEFIAAARTAVPALLDALDAAEARIGAVRRAAEAVVKWAESVADEDEFSSLAEAAAGDERPRYRLGMRLILDLRTALAAAPEPAKPPTLAEVEDIFTRQPDALPKPRHAEPAQEGGGPGKAGRDPTFRMMTAEEITAFWASGERIAAEVAKWPAWMRGGKI